MHLRRAYVNVCVEFTGNDGIGLPVRGRNWLSLQLLFHLVFNTNASLFIVLYTVSVSCPPVSELCSSAYDDASLLSEQITCDMKHAEEELYKGAKHLECTTYGVLHERHLEAFIAPQHWDSLMSGLVRVAFSVSQAFLLGFMSQVCFFVCMLTAFLINESVSPYMLPLASFSL